MWWEEHRGTSWGRFPLWDFFVHFFIFYLLWVSCTTPLLVYSYQLLKSPLTTLKRMFCPPHLGVGMSGTDYKRIREESPPVASGNRQCLQYLSSVLVFCVRSKNFLVGSFSYPSVSSPYLVFGRSVSSLHHGLTLTTNDSEATEKKKRKLKKKPLHI